MKLKEMVKLIKEYGKTCEELGGCATVLEEIEITEKAEKILNAITANLVLHYED